MPAQWKHAETEDDIAAIRVSLPTIVGIAPNRYVPVLYGVVAFALAFLVLVLPGLRSYGSRVTVVTAPAGASVYVGDTRIGTAPVTAFIEAGTHEISVRFPGLRDVTRTIEVRGRRVGSALVPRKQNVSIAFDGGIDVDQLHALIAEYHEWALGGRPGEQFQHPPLGRTVGRAVWSQVDDRSDSDVRVEEVIDSLIAGTVSANVPDLLGGLGKIYTPRSAFSLAGIESIVHKFIQLDNDSLFFSAAVDRWIEEIGRTTPVERYVASTWPDERSGARATALLAASVELDEGGIPQEERIVVGGSGFTVVPAGNYIVGYPLRNEEDLGLPIEVSEPFLLLDHEVTNEEYASFLADRSRWEPRNRDALVTAGLVDGDYLRNWPENWRSAFLDRTMAEEQSDQALPDEPVRFVSWYAAAAYADWFDERYGGGVRYRDASYRIQLPRSTTWEYAAFLNALAPVDIRYQVAAPAGSRTGTPGAIGAYHLQGNLWEWTADWYTPTYPILTASIGAQRQVIGGSYANERLPAGVTGGQPPYWCTAFLGFRLAAYPE